MKRREIKKRHFFIVAAVIFVMAWVALFGVKIPIGIYDFTLQGAPDMRFGIDIRGGVDAVFQPKDLARLPTAGELEAARAVIETRLDQKNILDRDVTVDRQSGFVIVRFPWKSDEKEFNPQQAIAELGETARLTFQDPQGNVIVDGTHVKSSQVGTNRETGGIAVLLEFDDEGARLIDEATARLVGQAMPIYMDERRISEPIVNSRITGGSAYIDKIGSTEEAQDLANKISAGSLPFSMVTRNHSSISPTLGAGALDIMVTAGAVAFGIICLFLLVYYRLPGFVACIALLMQVSGQLLALSLPQITLTLPGIAGIILSIGLGVDANIIISERISEELRAGKPLNAAIASGFKRAFSSVFDGNITVMIVAVLLMLLGSGAILSFAYSLLTGVILNFAAGVFASRLMIKSLSLFEPLRKPALYMKGWQRA
jgi:protein-export SecD/SecF family membrane protein